MVSSAKKKALHDKEYLIMIVDCQSSKVFSSCCKFYELYQEKLYHVEMIERRRKKFPKTDAIYFITPTKRSIQRLIDDFETKEKKGVNEELISKPQYGAVHLFFTSKVPESLI
jgi:syntaxin-binding protein 1